MGSTQSYGDWERQEHTTLLTKFAKEVLDPHAGVDYELLLASGDPRNVVLQVAEERKAFIVVVGSTGKNTWRIGLLPHAIAFHLNVHSPWSIANDQGKDF